MHNGYSTTMQCMPTEAQKHFCFMPIEWLSPRVDAPVPLFESRLPFDLLLLERLKLRGPKDHSNIRVSHSGSEARCKWDTRNHAM